MALPEVGVEAVIKNLAGFTAGANSINSAYNKMNVGADSVARSSVDLGNSLLKVGAIAGGAALAGVTALGAGLATFAITGISKAKDLDQQMANIAATMGKTKEAVGPLKDLILDLALDPNLTVTATQAADAIQLLAQNGATTDQIIDGLASSTVALANATGADFGVAANTASGIMQAFGLAAKDVGKAVDGITGVVNQSKFTIDDYATAFAQAGGVAAGVGVSLEDFNTVLAGTATIFSGGSDAGTSFKTLLGRLAAPTSEAKDEMEKYGISLFDATGKMRPLAEVAGQLNSVFNGTATITSTVGGVTKKEAQAAESASKAIGGLTDKIDTNQKQLQLYNDQLALEIGYYGEGSPKVRSRQLQIERLTNTINGQNQQLNDYQSAISLVNKAEEKQITTTKTLTEAEKANLAIAIGGLDAQRAVIALAGMSQEEFEKLSKTVNNSGLAFNAAATRVDSLQGAFDIFGGIIEAIQIQVGDLFLPVLRQVTSWFTDTATRVGPMVVAFFGQVAQGIGQLITFGTMLVTRFQQFGPGGLLAGLGLEGGALLFKKLSELFNLIMGDATNLSTVLTTTLGATLTWLSTNLLPMITQAVQFVIDHFEEFKGALLGIGAVLAAGVFAALVAGILSLLTPINLTIAGAALLGAAWAGNWGGIQEKTFAVWAVVQPILSNLAGWLSTNLPIAIAALTDAWSNVLFPAISAIWDFVSGTMFPLWLELQVWLAETLVTGITILSDTWTGTLLPAITAIWNYFNSNIMPLWVSIVNFINAVFTKALQALAGLWQKVLLPALTSVWNFISQNILPIFNEIWKTISEKLQPVISDIAQDTLPPFEKALGAISKAVKDLTGFFKSLTDVVKNFELPDVLTANSPTPMELALRGVAAAAELAGLSLGKMGRALNLAPGAIDKLLGVKRNIASVPNIIGHAGDNIEKFFDKAHLEGSKTKFALKVLKDVFRGNAAKILGAGDRKAQAAMFEQLAGDAVNWEKAGFSGDPGKILKGSFQRFIDEFAKSKDELEEMQQQIFIEAGRTALTIGQRLNDVISGSADILSTRVETLQDLITSGMESVNFEGQVISQTRAQELLNQALAEQVAIQDDLLLLRQNEAKLGFLEKQLNLIETINEAGLDVGSILGGLQLGINASIPDLIEATSRLVTAMIEQVDADLQIASPSKVMAQKGQFIGQGLVDGIMSSIGSIRAATQTAISGPALVSGPVGGGNTYNFNNNFGGNNISSGMDESQFDAMVLGSLQRLAG